jgi:Protein of unknown function (DUF1549)/Protein of unknown function (DUF1553)
LVSRIWKLSPVLLGALLVIAATGPTDQESSFIGSRGKYWAFQKVERPAVPSLSNGWIRNPIDAFILEGLEAKHLSPSPPLDRTKLIRRVSFDLTGLPPTPSEVQDFLHDKSPNAYEMLVDRLLASPHYGERWAQQWLDVVRYADTNGFELDADRTHAWRYRDYVIDSFNRDKPYDQFIKEQLAGDEMYPGDKQALVATGYLRAGSEHLVAGNIDPAVSRQEVLTEIATSVGQTYMALTVNCARCHNHKFDPILQADYYRLQAVFATGKGNEVEIATPQQKASWESAEAAYKERLKPVQDAIERLTTPYRERVEAERLTKLDPKVQDAVHKSEDKRTPDEKVLAANAKEQIEPTWDVVVAAMTPEDRDKRAKLREQLHQVEATEPDPLPTAYSYVNSSEPPPQSYVLRMGDPAHQLAPVAPSVPTVLKASYEIPSSSAGRRTALANWLADPNNPLTSRVMVNRIWQFRMGQGIVRTPNDFGVMGDRPSNKKLLDWLAAEFVSQGWNVKAMDRLIVLSNSYQQSSAANESGTEADPDNRLLWRMNRKRMDGEMIRDSVLSVSGDLNLQIGGRPVRVPIEPEVYNLIFTEHERDGLWPVNPDKRVQNRRSIYLYNKRSVRLPLLSAFDQPDAITSCPVRPVSTHALQALSLMNSDFMQRESETFADRLTKACPNHKLRCELQHAWQFAFSRDPTLAESKLAAQFITKGGTLQEMCLAILNRNEFVYVP